MKNLSKIHLGQCKNVKIRLLCNINQYPFCRNGDYRGSQKQWKTVVVIHKEVMKLDSVAQYRTINDTIFFPRPTTFASVSLLARPTDSWTCWPWSPCHLVKEHWVYIWKEIKDFNAFQFENNHVLTFWYYSISMSGHTLLTEVSNLALLKTRVLQDFFQIKSPGHY